MRNCLDMVQHKLPVRFRYVNNTSVVWPNGLDRLQNFFSPSTVYDLLSNLPWKQNQCDSFLGYCHQKGTHTGHFLNSESINHYMIRIILSIHSTASTTHQDQGLVKETDTLICDLQFNGYPPWFIYSEKLNLLGYSAM
jgi:hypothetical protein